MPGVLRRDELVAAIRGAKDRYAVLSLGAATPIVASARCERSEQSRRQCERSEQAVRAKRSRKCERSEQVVRAKRAAARAKRVVA